MAILGTTVIRRQNLSLFRANLVKVQEEVRQEAIALDKMNYKKRPEEESRMNRMTYQRSELSIASHNLICSST
jgi:hypothetical protein